MAQNTSLIDLRRTYIPIDPNAFPTILQAPRSGDEDSGGRMPIMPYDGYNFMPTPQGYSSFFGTNTSLGINALIGNVDDLFIIQSSTTLANTAVALKDDGIWVKDLASAGAWTQQIALAVPGLHKLWSKCVIEGHLYVYRAGEAAYWKWGPSTAFAFTQIVPTFLNMASQLGIFKAGGRLGFWDAENSTAWSAFENHQVFDPSVETLAGNAIFQDIVGKIVTVLQHGTGFIIYCTRSIVMVRRDNDSPMLFSGKSIFNNNGISYREEACFSDPDSKHFAMTTTGLCEIDASGNAEFPIPEISRYFKSRKEPMYVQLVNGKFLFFKFIPSDFNVGRLGFSNLFVEGTLDHWEAAKLSALTNAASNPRKALRQANWTREEIYLNNQYGYTSFAQASGVGVVPIWRNFFCSSPNETNLLAFKTALDAGTEDSFFTPYIVPGPYVPLTNWLGQNTYYTILQVLQNDDLAVAGFQTNYPNNANKQFTQDTQENFFSKQEWLWDLEDKYMKKLKEKLQSLNGAPVAYNRNYFTDEAVPMYTLDETTYETSPSAQYIDCSRDSASSRYYGLATKSAWAQRTYSKAISWRNWRRRIRTIQVSEARWFPADIGGVVPLLTGVIPIYDTYADCVSEDTKAEILALITATYPLYYGQYQTPAIIENVGGTLRTITHKLNIRRISDNVLIGTIDIQFNPHSKNYAISTVSATNWLADYGFPAIGLPVYWHQETIYEQFGVDITEHELPLGTYKSLAYTQIVGHGHYAGGVFVVDNATTETVDYTDVYTTGNYGPGQLPKYNNNLLPAPDVWDDCGIFTDMDADTIINGYVFEGPCEPAFEAVPSANFLFQAGSAEPLYPTFEGAFILDVHLKKWGKLKMQFKQIFDAYPINNMAGEGIFPYEHFLPKVAARKADGTFPVFDEYPADSEICFGKVGYYRKGFTDLEEVIAHNKEARTGVLRIEASIDSRGTEDDTVTERAYTAAALIQEGFSLSGRWYNIVFKAHYDLTHLEVRTVRRGSR